MKNFLKLLAIMVGTYCIAFTILVIVLLTFRLFNITISDFSSGFLLAIFCDYVYKFLCNKFLDKPSNIDEDAEDCVKEDIKPKASVISAFPGTGKTEFYKKHIFGSPRHVKDSDSSIFDKKEFPTNYINHIKNYLSVADIIFVSSHKEVRESLVTNNIEYTLVYPQMSCKDEYIARYKQRESSPAFIELLEKNWETFITDCMNQTNCKHIVLTEGQYISDVIH